MPTEEWVRLYIALRRVRQAGRGPGIQPKIACELLKDWKTRVSQIVSVKRKLLIVDADVFNSITPRPPNIDRWVVDPSTVILPADIGTSDIILVDDGYPRSQLDVPGVLHLEVGVHYKKKCPDERPQKKQYVIWAPLRLLRLPLPLPRRLRRLPRPCPQRRRMTQLRRTTTRKARHERSEGTCQKAKTH